jgi:hypothetical protein
VAAERSCPGDGTLLCLAHLPGARDPVATNDFIGINSRPSCTETGRGRSRHGKKVQGPSCAASMQFVPLGSSIVYSFLLDHFVSKAPMARSRVGERCHGAMAWGAARVRLFLGGLPMGGGTPPSGCTTAAEECSKASWVWTRPCLSCSQTRIGCSIARRTAGCRSDAPCTQGVRPHACSLRPLR